MNETVADHQHPDIRHIKFIGGPYTDRFLTKAESKSGKRSKYYVDTIAIHDGKEKNIRTEFKMLMVANSFIKKLREDPEVTVELVEKMVKAEILLQGRSPEDTKRIRIHNEDVMLEDLRIAFKDGKDRDSLFRILNYHLRDVTVKWKDRIDAIPYYIDLK